MRIIPKLEIKNNNVVKGINFEGLRVVGQPNDLSKRYYLDKADEIIYIDCVASLYNRNSLLKTVKEVTKDVFIPLSVGGGIKNITDVENLLKSGADKVAINTASFKDKDLLKKISNLIGSQSLIGSIQAKKITKKKWECFINFGRDRTGKDVIEWVKYIKNCGIGEILVSSINNDGRECGFDIDLYKAIRSITNLPIIASGGFGKVSHIIELCREVEIDGIAIGKSLHHNKITIKEIKEICKKNNLKVKNT